MEFVTEIEAAIKSGFDGFKPFIVHAMKNNKAYLQQTFWVPDGLQMTVLNYLIQQHQEQKAGSPAEPGSRDLRPFIDFVIANAQDKNAGEPLHQAISAGKIQLACAFLRSGLFELNRRDKEGHTLLSLILVIRSRDLLKELLRTQFNIHKTNLVIHEAAFLTRHPIECQPIHEAVLSNYPLGVKKLAKAGAQLSNPVGPLMDTPVLLAARLGHMKALTALLESPKEQLNLNAVNTAHKDGETAIEALCELLLHDKDNKELLNGVAKLLCCGAVPPRSEKMRQLLANKRSSLLQAIDCYLETKPTLVDDFVGRCHVTKSPLHSLIYVDHSWGNALRQLFGRPSKAALIVESWVIRKYSQAQAQQPNEPALLSTKAAVTFTGNEQPLTLYAEFVRRYDKAYSDQKITNPWSTMRWKIAEGRCTWDEVSRYAAAYPASRTGIIIKEMIKPLSHEVHNIPSFVIHDNLNALERPLSTHAHPTLHSHPTVEPAEPFGVL